MCVDVYGRGSSGAAPVQVRTLRSLMLSHYSVLFKFFSFLIVLASEIFNEL